MVIRYVDPALRNHWKSMAGYTARDWDDFCRELRTEYVDPASDSQYSKRKLFDFLEDSAHYLMEEENDVLRYYREFNLLSKPLFDSGRLTSQERDTAFMRGFHPDDRSNLLPRLIAKFPSVHGKRAFPFRDEDRAVQGDDPPGGGPGVGRVSQTNA
jgi:hypothetical protein